MVLEEHNRRLGNPAAWQPGSKVLSWNFLFCCSFDSIPAAQPHLDWCAWKLLKGNSWIVDRGSYPVVGFIATDSAPPTKAWKPRSKDVWLLLCISRHRMWSRHPFHSLALFLRSTSVLFLFSSVATTVWGLADNF
jgi:hypothetical protein